MPKINRVLQPEEGAVYVVLKSYLERLESLERSKPPDMRRDVPTIGTLAGELGIHRVTLSNIANGNIKDLNLQTAGRVITAMRRRGFSMDITDMLAYRAPESEAQ